MRAAARAHWRVSGVVGQTTATRPDGAASSAARARAAAPGASCPRRARRRPGTARRTMSALPRARAPASARRRRRRAGGSDRGTDAAWCEAAPDGPVSRCTLRKGSTRQLVTRPAGLVGVLGDEALGRGRAASGSSSRQDDEPGVRRIADAAGHDDAALVVPALDQPEVALAVRRAPLEQVRRRTRRTGCAASRARLSLLRRRRLRSRPACAGPAAR